MESKRIQVKGENGSVNHISIPIDDDCDEKPTTNLLATTLWKEMEELPNIPPECCIYRVPPSLKTLNERVYTPQVVSIGPFHHKKKELKRMEEHKLRYMKVFLGRTKTSLDDFITAIMGMEKRARDYYAEKITLSVDEFVKILVVDSVFILEIMFGRTSDPRHHSTYLAKHVLRFKTDLILLENQIPFFVLNNFFNLAFPELPRKKFLEVSISYLHDVVLIKDKSKLFGKVKEYLKSGPEIKHFLDLLRICQLPSASTRTQSANTAELIPIPNAVKLREAGIQLYKLDSSDCLLDIKYNKGVLKIPLLVVQEYSEIVLCNILILENFLYAYDSYVRDFVFFMQMLVSTAKDADLLIEQGIIEDRIGESSTIADLFNKVGREVMISSPSYYFYDVSKNLNRHCNVPLNKWKASFKRDYCSTPWMIASTTAAAILLILTLLSTVAAFLAI